MKMYREVIDKDKARKGFEKFIQLESGERLLLFCDDTILGGGQEGAVLTERRIIRFQKNDQQSFPLASLAKIDLLHLTEDSTNGLCLTSQTGETEEILLAGIDEEDLNAFVGEAQDLLSGSGTAPATPPAGEASGPESPASVKAPAPTSAKKRCKHEKKNERCSKKALPHRDFCWEHLPSNEKEAFHNHLRHVLSETNGLQGAYLEGVDMTPLTLKGANLSGANLATANLAGMDLGGTNLTKTDLKGTKLRKANLTRADLSGAQVSSGTDLRSSTIDGTIFRGVPGLSGVSFNGSYIGDLSGIPSSDKDQVRTSANRLDLMTPFMVFVMVFGGIFAFINMIAVFFTVAIPWGLKGIVAFFIIGWVLSGAVGGIIGAAVGAVVGIIPSLIIAKVTKGKRSPHAIAADGP